mmetsp:Transcript_95028/g.277883  ORF Transcript_95028/g.277883 Transcript_95028/m.277883 type:complete len:391 (-) Transcript_95028:55-1227(-)
MPAHCGGPRPWASGRPVPELRGELHQRHLLAAAHSHAQPGQVLLERAHGGEVASDQARDARKVAHGLRHHEALAEGVLPTRHEGGAHGADQRLPDAEELGGHQAQGAVAAAVVLHGEHHVLNAARSAGAEGRAAGGKNPGRVLLVDARVTALPSVHQLLVEKAPRLGGEVLLRRDARVVVLEGIRAHQVHLVEDAAALLEDCVVPDSAVAILDGRDPAAGEHGAVGGLGLQLPVDVIVHAKDRPSLQIPPVLEAVPREKRRNECGGVLVASFRLLVHRRVDAEGNAAVIVLHHRLDPIPQQVQICVAMMMLLGPRRYTAIRDAAGSENADAPKRLSFGRADDVATVVHGDRMARHTTPCCISMWCEKQHHNKEGAAELNSQRHGRRGVKW